jgi:hypothetical protein
MATSFFIDLDANRLVRSLTSTAPVSPTGLFRGDVLDANLYFLKQTGVAGAPYSVADVSAASVKFGIGSPLGVPTSGTWTLDGVSSFTYAATAAELQTALRTSQSDNALTVTGSMANGFTITWGAVGAESTLTGSCPLLLPECDLSITERIAGTGSVKEQQFVRIRLKPAVFQDTFTDISATASATISTVTGGDSTHSEIQKIAFATVPNSGGWTITTPADTRSVTAAVVAGVFTTTANHGLALNQPVVMTGFTAEANWTEGTTYYVKATPTPTTFTIAATSGGTAMTTATADAGTGTVTTVAETSAQLNFNATLAEVQAALVAMTSIGTGGVVVTGLPGEFYQLTFQGQKRLANFPAVTADTTILKVPTGKTASITLATYQLADLLGDEASIPMTLEIQLVEGSNTTTAVSQAVSISSDLIDGATLTPATRSGALYGDGTLLTFADVPATASSAGEVGQIAQDGTNLYLCTAANTWVRALIATTFSTF